MPTSQRECDLVRSSLKGGYAQNACALAKPAIRVSAKLLPDLNHAARKQTPRLSESVDLAGSPSRNGWYLRKRDSVSGVAGVGVKLRWRKAISKGLAALPGRERQEE
jgi:hypothetical protein